MRFLVVLLSLVPVHVLPQSSTCARAPTAALRTVCEQLHRWDSVPPPDSSSIQMPAINGNRMLAAEMAPAATSLWGCMDIACICTYLRGSGGNNCQTPQGPLRKAYRREYRTLSDDERNRFHAAMRAIKNNGEYDRLAAVHSQFATSGGAHSGPAFMPWHREFIKRMEIALRQVDPSVSLPYWDSTLDQQLPQSRYSVMWTDELMGRTDSGGNLVTGPFAPWRTLNNRPNIRRAVAAQAKLFDEAEITFTMQQTDVAQVLAFTAARQGCPYQVQFNVLEYTHGNIHIYTGGDLLDQTTAANDPIFFLHHSFVDLIWEQWRQTRQSRYSRERDWPMDTELCASSFHFSTAFMRPFQPMRNIDGISNEYTDNLYSYAPRPTCNDNCGNSRFLFCDYSHGTPHCSAKVMNGGPCDSYRSREAACYNGYCNAGVCVQTQVAPPTPPPVVVAPTAPVAADCFNEHECCSTWSSQGECSRNPVYMLEWCKASCSRCRPNYDIRNECADRHSRCAEWSRAGECTNNPLWMAENCRRSCNRCSLSRARQCGASQQAVAAPPRPPVAAQPACDSIGCFNENICCPLWSQQGRCSTNQVWMSCNCRVSCSLCRPNYAYGGCADFHESCPQWAFNGECNRNPWMPENCRLSCGTCYSWWELQGRCRSARMGRSVKSAFIDLIRM